MKARLLLFLALFSLTTCTTHSQGLEPVEVAKHIFGKTKFADLPNYSTGEYQGHPNGQDLPPTATTDFLLLGQTPIKAVVAMSVVDAKGIQVDTYLHFQKDTVWKLSAFRSLAMTGMLAKVSEQLESLTPRQVDEMLKSAAKEKGKDKHYPFSSRAEYEFTRGNTKLTIASDAQLIAHFTNNKAEFERIKVAGLQELSGKTTEDTQDQELAKPLEAAYRKLYISSVRSGGDDFGNCLNFLIGGMVDNAVGYLYIKDKKDLPEMSANDIIMLREIGDGWYLYKTT
jgi:hypothetical protein